MKPPNSRFLLRQLVIAVLNHRLLYLGLIALLVAAPARAQFGVPWQRTPAIAVISIDGKDPRHALVEEAIDFWNRTLQEVNSGLRLGPAVRHALPIPEEDLRTLSASIVGRRGSPVQVPPSLRGLPGDLTILLANSDFVSFAGPFDPEGKRVVGIKGAGFRPLTLPNVALNVIAHELGHAIGLGHNSDPTKLMCGRPAPCRPDAFSSAEPKLFPLTDEEKGQLRAMYPADWKPRAVIGQIRMARHDESRRRPGSVTEGG